MATTLTARAAKLAAILCPLLVAALAVHVAPAGATVVQVQQGTEASANNGSITPTLPSASTAGTLLVAVLENGHSTTAASSAPTGWTKAVSKFDSCCGEIEIWYYANNPGGISSATFTASSGTDSIIGELSEWNGIVNASPVDQTGTLNKTGSSASATVQTSANLAVSGDLGITGFSTQQINLASFTAGSGWAHLYSDPTGGYVGDWKTGLASGAKASETETVSPNAVFIGAIATFKASTCSGGSLGLTAPSSASFPSFTLDGTDQSATTTVTLKPDDETSAHSGWNVTETSTTFNDGSGHTLPTTATATTAASTATTGGNCVMPTNSITYPVTLPAGSTAPTAVKAYNAASATGQGPTNVTLTFQLSVPANTFRGTYTSTWTFAIVSGP